MSVSAGMDARERKRLGSRNWWRQQIWLRFEKPYIRCWSPLEDARLAALAFIGAPLKLAVTILERPKAEVLYRRAKLGLPRFRDEPPPRPQREQQHWDEQRIKALEHALRTLSYSQAAERFGTTRSAISGAITRHLPHLRRPMVRG